MLNIKVTRTEFQRNGISGRSFYSVYFSFDTRSNMMAVMPANPKMDCGVECYVIDLDAPEESWRGDDFAPEIKTACDNHEAKLQEDFRSFFKMK